jgi:hypothetical protein
MDIQKYEENVLPPCSICHEPIYPRDMATLQCGHKFHKNCIAIWAKNPNNLCPMCRAVIEIQKTPDTIKREVGGFRSKKSKSKKSKSKKSKSKKSKSKKSKRRN